MADCLIVAVAADRYAEEVTRCADFPLAVKACNSAQAALDAHSGERVLFGDPDMIAQILPHMPEIDWVQSTWAGVTNLVETGRRDFVLTGVKRVFGPQISEYVMGYLLAHELKVLRRMEEQRRHNWFAVESGTLHGKCLGIMGTGSLGRHIADAAAHFGTRVTGLSRSGAPTPGFDKVSSVDQLHEFLSGIDYLVSTLPHTDATDNLLDTGALSKLPDHAYFINVGRGNVVDDQALIVALRNGRLAGATLDVFDEEPIPEESPLWDTPNLSITAHIASISRPSLIAPIFVDNYRRYMDERPLEFVVDFDAGY